MLGMITPEQTSTETRSACVHSLLTTQIQQRPRSSCAGSTKVKDGPGLPLMLDMVMKVEVDSLRVYELALSLLARRVARGI